jgi:hypothetical protein
VRERERERERRKDGRKMESIAPIYAGEQSARTHTPESLRQRQRDRLSPRGRLLKSTKISASVRELDKTLKSGITLSPAPRPKPPANRSAEAMRKKPLPGGLRKENSVHRRAKREVEDARNDITPDGGSAGREGRQFTVAKVGNNGRIYLR